MKKIIIFSIKFQGQSIKFQQLGTKNEIRSNFRDENNIVTIYFIYGFFFFFFKGTKKYVFEGPI